MLFKNCKNSNSRGNIGLSSAIDYFTRLGYIVSIPLNDSQKYDLIVDSGKVLQRVQVKTTSKKQSDSNNYIVKLDSQAHNFVSKFDNTAIELLYILTEMDEIYIIPASVIESKTAISLTDKLINYKIVKG